MAKAASVVGEPENGYEDQEDEQLNSEYRIAWINAVDKGAWKAPTSYHDASVLMLRWNERSTNWHKELSEEMGDLQRVFREKFNYSTQIEELNDDDKVQAAVNYHISKFVHEKQDHNNLLIVYYAGHGRPGQFTGSVEMAPKTKLLQKGKIKLGNSVVWNKAEKAIESAQGTVLVIFDSCYSGLLTRGRGGERPYEFLGASDNLTPLPGDESFTRALINSLEKLCDSQPEGRFTTYELKRTLISCGANDVVLADRTKKLMAGKIMLHPIKRESRTIAASNTPCSPNQHNWHTVTLTFDFPDKPRVEEIECLANHLNTFYDKRPGAPYLVRWMGIRHVAGHVIRKLKRTTSGKKRKLSLEVEVQGEPPWKKTAVPTSYDGLTQEELQELPNGADELAVE